MRAKGFHPGLAVTVLLFAAMNGCEMKGDRVVPRDMEQALPGVWQVRPVQLRIYPSTRFVQYENQLALEARVEFLDELGDPLKAVGTLLFEVYPANRDGEVIDQRRLFSWEVPMLTKQANQEYYDAVTRAYLFRLGIDTLPKDLERTVLRVSFTPPTGDRMITMAVIRLQ